MEWREVWPLEGGPKSDLTLGSRRPGASFFEILTPCTIRDILSILKRDPKKIHMQISLYKSGIHSVDLSLATPFIRSVFTTQKVIITKYFFEVYKFDTRSLELQLDIILFKMIIYQKGNLSLLKTIIFIKILRIDIKNNSLTLLQRLKENFSLMFQLVHVFNDF